MITGWPFQNRIVGQVRDALRYYRFPCLVVPTGGGKTIIAMLIALQVMAQLGENAAAGSVLFFVHKRELLRQAINKFTEVGLGGKIGIIAADQAPNPWKPIQIASIPTLTRRIDMLSFLDMYWPPSAGVRPEPKVIFVDEAHHATANTWEKVIQRWKDAYAIGMTATPYRTDNKGLGNIIDHLILGPQIKDLVNSTENGGRGFLAPTRAISIDNQFSQQVSQMKMLSGSDKEVYMASVVDSWEQHASDRKTIFFAADLAHSEAIVAELKRRGYRAAHMDYKTPDHERERIYDQMQSGTLDCVSNMRMFSEGVDWVQCSAVWLARPMGSLVEYRQATGRGMRLKPLDFPHQDNLVGDLVGNWRMHGEPEADIFPTLEYGVDRDQRKALGSSTRTCERCGYQYPRVNESPDCPFCGHVQTSGVVVNEIDAKLVEVKASPRRKMSRSELSDEVIATMGDREKIEAIRRRQKYHPKWTNRMIEVYSRRWADMKARGETA